MSAQFILQAAVPCLLTVSGADESEAGDNPEEGHCDNVKMDQNMGTYLSMGPRSTSTNQKLAYMSTPACARGKLVNQLQLVIKFR